MANEFITNNAKPAQYKNRIANLPGFLSGATISALAEYRERYEAVHKERIAYGSDKASELIHAINQKALEDPNPENVAARMNCNPERIRKEYDDKANALGQIEQSILHKAKPLMQKIRDGLLPVIDKDIADAEAINRATSEKFGVDYDPESDPVLNSLKRFRGVAEMRLGESAHQAVHPSELDLFLGELRPRAGTTAGEVGHMIRGAVAGVAALGAGLVGLGRS